MASTLETMFPHSLVPPTVMNARVFLPVLLVMKVMKFSLTERALIFATLKELLSTARMTNHANFAMNLSKAVFFAMKMAPNVPNVMTTLIFTKGFVTLNALLMSTVKSH